MLISGLLRHATTPCLSDDRAANAVSSYERAVQLDPNFAIAWARLSRAQALIHAISDTGGDPSKRALDNAQKLAPNSPETLLALGYYQFQVLRDYGATKSTFDRVSKMRPGNSEVLLSLSKVTRRQEHWDQAIAYFEQALPWTRVTWSYSWRRQLHMHCFDSFHRR